MEANVFIDLTDVRRDAFHFGVPNRISRNYQYIYIYIYCTTLQVGLYIMLCTRGLNPLQYIPEKWQLEDHSSSFWDDIFSGAILY